MKKIVLIFALLLSFTQASFAEDTPAPARDLQSIMKEMGGHFKLIGRAAARARITEEVKLGATALKAAIAEGVEALPVGVDPADLETVERFQGLMRELLVKAELLEELILAADFDRTQALAVLGEMNELRKQGHDLFRIN